MDAELKLFLENMQTNLQNEIQKQADSLKIEMNQRMDQFREEIRSMFTVFSKDNQLKELQHLAEMFGRHELELKQLKYHQQDGVEKQFNDVKQAGFTDLHKQINTLKSEQRYMKIKMFDFERALDEH